MKGASAFASFAFEIVRVRELTNYDVSAPANLPMRTCVIQGRSLKIGVTMAKAKKTVRRVWTKDDLKQLKTMGRAKAGVTRTAKALKRTVGATANMATKLGVSLSMRG